MRSKDRTTLTPEIQFLVTYWPVLSSTDRLTRMSALKGGERDTVTYLLRKQGKMRSVSVPDPDVCEPTSPEKLASMSPGGRLRAWRRTRNMTQADLARVLCLSAMAVSNLETGKSRPRALTSYRIEDAIGIPARDWF